MPGGYDAGDFGASLQALILSLKYCGNMSEPKIGEFLENFDVQVSAGSLSNILTLSAHDFEQEYHGMLVAGLSSTTLAIVHYRHQKAVPVTARLTSFAGSK